MAETQQNVLLDLKSGGMFFSPICLVKAIESEMQRGVDEIAFRLDETAALEPWVEHFNAVIRSYDPQYRCYEAVAVPRSVQLYCDAPDSSGIKRAYEHNLVLIRKRY